MLPIIYRYVTQLSKAVVSLFSRLTRRKESGAKMEGKLLKGGTNFDKNSLATKQNELLSNQ